MKSRAYKKKEHATPDTLPIDIKILDVTKIAHLGAHVNIHLQAMASVTSIVTVQTPQSPTRLVRVRLLQYDRYG